MAPDCGQTGVTMLSSFHFNQVKFDEDEDAFQKMCDSLLFCLNSSFLSLVARTGVGGCTRVGG